MEHIFPEKLSPNESELLLKVADGDEIAFHELFRNYYGLLTAYIFRITKSTELSEEVISDVFLKIWLQRETLSGIKNFKAYLFVVSCNHALNALKKKIREWKQQKQWEQENQSIAIETDVTENSSVGLMMDEAIDHLSPRQKEIYLLHRHERLTYIEIADRLGIGRESVKTHLKIAVRQITDYLQSRLQITPCILFILLLR
jgi:RNA polymerase sigma-70 factor (ECF subfamily)